MSPESKQEREQRPYASKDVQLLTGMSEMQVKWLGDIGAVKPIQNVRGPGRRRRYDERGMMEFFVANELRRFGVHHQVVAYSLQYMREQFPNWYKDEKEQRGRFLRLEVTPQGDGDYWQHTLEKKAEAMRWLSAWAKRNDPNPSPILLNIDGIRDNMRLMRMTYLGW